MKVWAIIVAIFLVFSLVGNVWLCISYSTLEGKANRLKSENLVLEGEVDKHQKEAEGLQERISVLEIGLYNYEAKIGKIQEEARVAQRTGDYESLTSLISSLFPPKPLVKPTPVPPPAPAPVP